MEGKELQAWVDEVLANSTTAKKIVTIYPKGSAVSVEKVVKWYKVLSSIRKPNRTYRGRKLYYNLVKVGFWKESV